CLAAGPFARNEFQSGHSCTDFLQYLRRNLLNRSCDIAVIGSGFAGSLMAMIARRLGHSVMLLERGTHPRFVIGESSTPLTNLLWEELARRYDLPALLPLAKFGSWQKEHPEIGCGLKRGFTFYHHIFDQPFDPDRENQLLVGASPHDEIADTHWYRPDFDFFLVREAQRLGVEFKDRCELGLLSEDAPGLILTIKRPDEQFELRASLVIDASGPRGFLHRALLLPELTFAHLPFTQGLYSHFKNVRRIADMNISLAAGATPYPVDDAATHHVFDGGWIWVLRFNNGITSAGVAATARVANELNFAEGNPAWLRLLDRLPMVKEQFAGAEVQFPFVHAPRLSFRSGEIAGAGWVLLPSAVGFVDPLLSTGFPLTLLGIARLAEAIEKSWGAELFPKRLSEYSIQTVTELSAAEQLVAALYSNMNDFSVFAALSLLYFAAASYSETARRLGKPELARSFLLFDDPKFGAPSRKLIQQAVRGLEERDKAEFIQRIRRVIEPNNVAGLGDPQRRNWYPAQASDLLAAAGKLGVTRSEIEALLLRCGFTGP
ncbi:MAG TPA: tryptophan 7-halogenase, partial [Candidatus Eisenbacteria bacterium]|nr:tryptophan 7-halogenase [Candidatus Eisenbacteria bacterium]